MSVTQADLDALDAMIASGVIEAKYDGKQLTYRSMKELREARADVAAKLASAAGTSAPSFVNPVFDRGV